MINATNRGADTTVHIGVQIQPGAFQNIIARNLIFRKFNTLLDYLTIAVDDQQPYPMRIIGLHQHAPQQYYYY
jgi:hypothetical protein